MNKLNDDKESLFYVYRQCNSGGHFIIDPRRGVSETLVIEAFSEEQAWERLEMIGDNVCGFWSYCECCGERWNDSDVKIFKKDELLVNYYLFDNSYYIHYLDGRIEEKIIPYKK